MIFNRHAEALRFFVRQSATQFISLVVGLIVVRFLAVENYAVYAFFGALVGAAATSSDMGVSTALITLLSRNASDSDQMLIIRSAFHIRSILTLISIISGLTIFFVLSPSARVIDIVDGLICAFAMICIIAFQASATLSKAVLSSKRNLRAINRADPLAALFRLLIVGIPFAAFGEGPLVIPLFAWVFGSGLVALLLSANIGKISFFHEPRLNISIIRIIGPLFPWNIYFVLSGLIPYLSLASFSFSSTNDVAGFAALSRIGVAFSIFDPLITYVAHPYVSRGVDIGFGKRSRKIIVMVFAICTAGILSGMYFPGAWLWIIGPNYYELEAYVPFAILLASIAMMHGVLYRMVAASGETQGQYIVVLTGIISQAVLYIFMPIIDVKTAFIFSISTTSAALTAQSFVYLRSANFVSHRIKRKSISEGHTDG